MYVIDIAFMCSVQDTILNNENMTYIKSTPLSHPNCTLRCLGCFGFSANAKKIHSQGSSRRSIRVSTEPVAKGEWLRCCGRHLGCYSLIILLESLDMLR